MSRGALFEKFEGKEVPVEAVKMRPGAYVPGGAESISRKVLKDLVRGTKTPILVRPVGDCYEVIAGDIEFLAAKRQGQQAVDVQSAELSDRDALLLRLLEGCKRGDVNVAEEAEIIRELNREHGLTQHEIAVRCDRVQSTVANKLRLLKLPQEVLESLRRGEIGERHARALLKVPDPDKQLALFRRCLKGKLSATEMESMCGAAAGASARSRHKKSHLGVVKDPRIYQNALRSVVREMQKAGLSAFCEEDIADNRWEFKVCLTVSEG